MSLPLRNVSIVDSVWSLYFLAAAVAYAVTTPAPDGPRRTLIVVLVAVWAVRLSGYITWRNWGEGEDKRYVAMREKYGRDTFPSMSLVRVFLLQGVLACPGWAPQVGPGLGVGSVTSARRPSR